MANDLLTALEAAQANKLYRIVPEWRLALDRALRGVVHAADELTKAVYDIHNKNEKPQYTNHELKDALTELRRVLEGAK